MAIPMEVSLAFADMLEAEQLALVETTRGEDKVYIACIVTESGEEGQDEIKPIAEILMYTQDLEFDGVFETPQLDLNL